MQNFIEINISKEVPKRGIKGPMACFFIVNKRQGDDFIDETAKNFVDERTWYHFYGLEERRWHMAFDLAFIDRYPDYTEENLSITCGYDEVEDFVYMMREGIDLSEEKKQTVYLLYDNEEVLKEVKALLAAEG